MVVLVLRGVHRTRAHGSSAQSLVEFALIVPFLALLFLGAVDLTRGFYFYIELQNASREAARVLIDYPEQYTDYAACQTTPEVNALGLSCSGGTLIINPKADPTISPAHRLPGRHPVTVTAKMTFTPMTPLIQNFTGGTITLQAQTTMVTWY